jgi:hypothetical protein
MIPEAPGAPAAGGRLLTRRRFLGLAAFAAAAAGAGVYARWGEPEWIEWVRRPMPVPGLPASLEGRTLLHLSDLHVGPNVDEGYLRRVFAAARALAPDLVVYTGDLVTWMGRRPMERLRRVLADAPRGRIATLAILGNHDYGLGWSDARTAATVAAVVRDSGLDLLRNEHRVVEGLALAGLDDLWARHFEPERTFTRVDPSLPLIALSHNPDTVDRPGWSGREAWILSGHTHGGQVRIPLFGAPILPVRNRRYAAGEVRLGPGRMLYVSRGVGHVLPVRYNCRPEATLFEMTGRTQARDRA